MIIIKKLKRVTQCRGQLGEIKHILLLPSLTHGRMHARKHARTEYLIGVMWFVGDPFLQVSFVPHRQRANSSFGRSGRRHVKLHLAFKCRRHLPIWAQLQTTEECMRMAQCYKKKYHHNHINGMYAI